MADSEVQIINSAASLIGEDFITSLDDGTPFSNKAKLKWPLARDHVQRQHPFNCSVDQAILEPLSTKPLFGFKEAYLLPNDPFCLRALSIDVNFGTTARLSKGRNVAPFFIQGRKLLTNVSDEIPLTFIKRVLDPTDFDAMLVTVLTWRLAMELSYDVTGSNTNFQKAKLTYEDELRRARSIDAREQGNWYPDSPSVMGRFGGNASGVNVIPPPA